MARTTTATATTNSTITIGQTDSDAAVVTGNASGGSPTGTVTFYRVRPAVGARSVHLDRPHRVGTPIVLTAGANDTSTATSATFKPTSVGYWCFAASYSGDANYSASSDTSASECVNVTGTSDDRHHIVAARDQGTGLHDHPGRPWGHDALHLVARRSPPARAHPQHHDRGAVGNSDDQRHLPRSRLKVTDSSMPHEYGDQDADVGHRRLI